MTIKANFQEKKAKIFSFSNTTFIVGSRNTILKISKIVKNKGAQTMRV